MKRITRTGLMLVAVLAFAASPSAWATCNLDTQIIGNTLGGWIDNCPDANPIEAYAWLLSSPATVNSVGQEFICRSDDQFIADSGVSCNAMPGSGVAGDGLVTVYLEYGTQNFGILGCPNQAQTQVDNPMGVQITCNNGASVLMNLGYFFDAQQYIVDVVSPSDGSMVISASFANGLQVTSVGAGPSPSASNVCVNVSLPTVLDDCNPDTLGGGLTCGGPRPAPALGILMTTNGPCGTNPDLRAANWVATPVQPDGSGNACNTLDPPAGSCAYLGMQGKWGTVDAGGIISWVAAGNLAASDKVKIDSAATAQGKVKVDFSTTNETSIVGFNVYSDGAKLNSTLISSKGAGNNAYSFEVGRGALKGGKSVLVEAVKKDGTVEKTAPVSLK